MIKELCDECEKEVALGCHQTIRVTVEKYVELSRVANTYAFCSYSCFENSVKGGGK